jgi:cytosine/adenosine deaminase-related metal-dependent hydrolase
MGERTIYGPMITPNGPQEGYLVIRDGTIVEKGRGEPSGGKGVRGMIVPGLKDLHTHLGDHGARGDLPADLCRAVHPGGVKDRFFSGSSWDDQVRSYRSAVEELSPGVSLVMDYRERGLEGIRIAKEALNGVGPARVLVLGRPNGTDAIGEIVRSSDGLGIPSLASADAGHREKVREAGGIYSIHASELYREDVDKVLKLDPDLVIHMVSATRDDWMALVKADIPVCICPRANAAFGIPVPLYEMHRAGLRIVLGTDNALAVKQDMWREMETAWSLLRMGGMGGTDASRAVFDMAVGRTLEGTRLGGGLSSRSPLWEDGWPRVGDPAHLSVLRIPEGEGWRGSPIDHLVRFIGQKDVLPLDARI